MNCLIVFVLFATAATVHGAPSLWYNTTLVCYVPGVQEWCASVYYHEKDSFSADDPLMWFQACTTDRKMNFLIDGGNPGGDGMWGVLQSHYEIGFTVYHSCTDVNAKNGNNYPEECDCTPADHYILVWYDGYEQRIAQNLVYWPYRSYPGQDKHCGVPEAFRGFESEGLPKKTCSWTEDNKNETLIWVSSH